MIYKKYISAGVGLLRVPTYLLILQYVLLGIFYGLTLNKYFFDAFSFLWMVFHALLIFLMIASWYINGTSMNDLSDYEIDLINLKNDKNRPLVTGLISKNQLKNISLVCALMTISFASFLGVYTLILAVFFIFLNWAYSLKPIQLSHRGGLAPALLPLGYVMFPFLSGYFLITDNIDIKLCLLILGLYLLFMSRILLKDFRDVVGDAKNGKITFLLKYGVKKVCLAASVAFVAGILVLILAFWRVFAIQIFPMLFFASLGISILYYLSTSKTWPKQKPFITIFGRIGTGILVLIAVSFSFQYQPVIYWKQLIVSLAVVGLILNSFGGIIKSQSNG